LLRDAFTFLDQVSEYGLGDMADVQSGIEV
jgi:hypothetical protein